MKYVLVFILYAAAMVFLMVQIVEIAKVYQERVNIMNDVMERYHNR